MTREESLKTKYNKTHKIENNQIYKKCSKCNEWFPCTHDYFYTSNNKWDGLSPRCQQCIKKQNHQWATDNKDRVKEINHQTNLRPERQQYNREKSKRMRLDGYFKQWGRENPDKIKEYNQKRLLHKQHKISNVQWESCKKYFDYKCAYCGLTEDDNKQIYNEQLHKEHVEYDGSNDLSNCVPACKSCNCQKWMFTLDEWYNAENPNYTQERYNRIIQWITKDHLNYT